MPRCRLCPALLLSLPLLLGASHTVLADDLGDNHERLTGQFERALGRSEADYAKLRPDVERAHAEVLRDLRLVPRPEKVKDLNQVLAGLVKVAHRPTAELELVYYTDSSPNAGVHFDTYVYVSTGLLETLPGKGARAFVLAHELAHILNASMPRTKATLEVLDPEVGERLYEFLEIRRRLEHEADVLATFYMWKAGYRYADCVPALTWCDETEQAQLALIDQCVVEAEELAKASDSADVRKKAAERVAELRALKSRLTRLELRTHPTPEHRARTVKQVFALLEEPGIRIRFDTATRWLLKVLVPEYPFLGIEEDRMQMARIRATLDHARAHGARGDWAEAIKLAEPVVGWNGRVLVFVARAKMQLKDWKGAAASFEAALAIDPLLRAVIVEDLEACRKRS